MAEDLIRCPCNNCSGHLEFEAEAIGQTVACPHCGLDTLLFRPAVSVPHNRVEEVEIDPPKPKLPPPPPPPVPAPQLMASIQSSIPEERFTMATVRKVGLLGAGLMVVGSFLPFASMPIMGSVNYFNNAQGDGIIVVALAAAVIATVLSRRPRWLWLYGIAGAGVLGFDLVNMVANIHEMRRTVETEMQDNMFGGIAVGMANAVQIQIGPAVIGIGIALVCGAAAVLGTIRKNERRF